MIRGQGSRPKAQGPTGRAAIAFVALGVALAMPVAAQQPRAGGAPSARASAPVDLTGTYVSIVTEDWRWRMRVPPKGDYASVPMTPAARQLADTWTDAKDGQCEAYGVGAA